VIFGFVFAYLLRALRWLETMRLALMQARKWLRSRYCCLWAADKCWKDAQMFGRLARQDLSCWREAVVLSWREFPTSDLEGTAA